MGARSTCTVVWLRGWDPEMSHAYIRVCDGDQQQEVGPSFSKYGINLGYGLESYSIPMYVADINDDCILGLDYLKARGAVIDLDRGVLDWLSVYWQQENINMLLIHLLFIEYACQKELICGRIRLLEYLLQYRLVVTSQL